VGVGNEERHDCQFLGLTPKIERKVKEMRWALVLEVLSRRFVVDRVNHRMVAVVPTSNQ
jgi:hypothetical protein